MVLPAFGEMDVMNNPNPYMNPDSYEYNQSSDYNSSREYLETQDVQRQSEYTTPEYPVYPWPEMARHMEGEKLNVERRPRAESPAFVSTVKTWLIAALLVGLGVLSALIGGRMAGASTPTIGPPPMYHHHMHMRSPSQDDNGGTFFQQRGPDSGGYNSGNFDNDGP